MKMKKPRNKTLKKKRKPPGGKREAETRYDAVNLEQFTRNLKEEEGFSRHPSNVSLQQQALLALQSSSGNTVMRKEIENLPIEKLNRIQREVAEEEGDPGLAGFEIEETLEGHPLNEMEVMRQIKSTLARQPARKTKTITANISLMSNPPTIVRPSEASLNKKYGANIAGWTKPKIRIRVLPGRGRTINLQVTLNFKMELAKEFTGGRLTILQDHENGHVTIGNKLAQTHAVSDLKKNIEALPRITQASVKRLVNAAHAKFKTEEGKKAKAYDKVDYPRMKLAYFGEKTPLADLSKSYPNIKTMVGSLNAFKSGADKSNFASLGGAVLTADKALSKDDLARLQYNATFKNSLRAPQPKSRQSKKHWERPTRRRYQS